MSRRGARRPRRKRGGGSSGWWWAAVAVIAAAIAAAFAVFLRLAPEPIDEATLCPAKTGPEAGIVILIDLTDPLSGTQHARLRGILEHAVAEAAPHTFMAIAAVAAAGGGPTFALCKPLDGAGANKLYENPRKIAERYESGFRRPLDSLIERLTSNPGAPESPIMESLQAALAETPGFIDASYPRGLTIVSDLLQHSEAFSFYRGHDWGAFERSPDFARMANNLRGVDVHIYRVPRPAAGVDGAIVEDFWVRYLDRSGAQSVRTEPLGDL